MPDTLGKLQYPLQNYNTTKFYTEMATARWLLAGSEVVVGRQVLLRLRGYISVCPTLQLSHNDVGGVGAWGVLQRGGPESFPRNLLSIACRRRHLHIVKYLINELGFLPN